METNTLFIAFALASGAIAVLMAILALYRKERAATIYAVGFGCGALGAALLAAWGGEGPLLIAILARTLFPASLITLVFALRSQRGLPRPWPLRFWAYALALAGAGLLLGFALRSAPARTAAFQAIGILLSAEFLNALSRGEPKPSPPVRAAAWTVALGYAAAQTAGIAIIALGPREWNDPVTGGPVLPWNLAAGIVFAILWAGLVFLMETDLMLGRLEKKNAMLGVLARTDELTGLYNRHLLDSSVRTEMERSARYKQPLSLIMYDLDHFKRVNDVWGHHAGDEVLKHTSRIVRELIREPDRLFRWGGEEFVILVPHTPLEGALSLAEKIRLAIASEAYPAVGTVTASFGAAEWRKHDSVETWFKQVDQALYRAKNEGRNRVVGFGDGDALPAAHVRMELRAEWESGDALIDAEHRQLFEMANGLLDASLSQGPKDEIESKLHSMLAHIERHFADEEELLGRLGYPGLADHSRLHRGLVAEALDLKARTEAKGGDPSAYFDFLVGKIIMGHLLKADILFFPYTRGAADAGARP
jgi:diguanylate cyclase (GGDEF)-like protein/hemerythrin-like metal-binding protein